MINYLKCSTLNPEKCKNKDWNQILWSKKNLQQQKWIIPTAQKHFGRIYYFTIRKQWSYIPIKLVHRQYCYLKSYIHFYKGVSKVFVWKHIYTSHSIITLHTDIPTTKTCTLNAHIHTRARTHTRTHTGYLMLLSYEGDFILNHRAMLFNINEVTSECRICEWTAGLSSHPNDKKKKKKLSFCLTIYSKDTMLKTPS